MIVAGIQQPIYKHGAETWVLHRCECGCHRTQVEKIDGKWTLEQLGYEIGKP